MRIVIIVILFVILIYEISYSADYISIDTKTTNFFDNFVSDTTLLLDIDLQKTVSNDRNNIVNNSEFKIMSNSWIPQPDPKIILKSIYENANTNNINQLFSDIARPVVEIACTSKQNDPLNISKYHCMKSMLNYSIIDDIKINYTFKYKKTIDEYISDLSNISDYNNRYKQIICTSANIINSAYVNATSKNIVKNVNIFKKSYPLLQVNNVVKTDAEQNMRKGYSMPRRGPSSDPTDIANCKKSCEMKYDMCARDGNQAAYTEIEIRRNGQRCSRNLTSCNSGCEPFGIFKRTVE
ncbi:hypothetical protein [Trichlorobacter lovleyi]|uniref:hypothetical protein n=1 Tax=Trichlorobacter lovleyi TaxID=313985 RepID=UPI0023F0667D|nr:hypothetical protein [Trichlorobacter lovleyi]